MKAVTLRDVVSEATRILLRLEETGTRMLDMGDGSVLDLLRTAERWDDAMEADKAASVRSSAAFASELLALFPDQATR